MTQRDESESPAKEVVSRIPLEIKLKIRDAYGREKAYTYVWEAIEQRAPGSAGSSGITVTTGMTDHGSAGVRAECEVRVGL